MTFRAKPAVKRNHRPAWESEDRRNLIINLSFVGVILLGVLILAGAAGATYYGEHFATVATVNGQAISKDDLTQRALVETFRLTRIQKSIQDGVASGTLSQDQANQQFQQLQSQANNITQTSFDALVDATLQGQLAAKMGITVSDEQISQKLVDEATSPEFRRAWQILVFPESSAGTTPTDAEKAAAKAKADKALADIKAGQKWEDVANAVSGGSVTTGGDLGWISTSDGFDQAFVDAVFKLEVNGVTDVVEAADGSYRLGRVTEIQASRVDPNYQQSIKDAGVALEAYKAAVRAELVKTALSDKIANDAVSVPSVMRRVSQIFISGSPGGEPADEVKAAHILFSPKGDPQNASSVPETDPSWAQAEASANTAYAILKQDPAKFEELAKTLSDDKGSGTAGGELGWFKQATVDASFGTAAFTPGLTAGQILAPIKSQFGWHIIRFESRRPDASVRIQQVHDAAIAAGADFAALAKTDSEGEGAAVGGDIGWVAANQLGAEREAAIFTTPVGGVSDVVSTSSGYYVFKVLEEQTRTPDGDQATTLKAKAFNNWYAAQKKAAAIIVEDDQFATPAASG